MEKNPIKRMGALLPAGAGAAAISSMVISGAEAPPAQHEMMPKVDSHNYDGDSLQAADHIIRVAYTSPHSHMYEASAASHTRKHHRLRFTGYSVEGLSSTFGPPDEPAGETADGRGTSARPCIALRNEATKDHRFLLVIYWHHKKFRDITFQCDEGPGILSRATDITGAEVWRILHIPQDEFPTDQALTVVRELKGPKVS